MSEAELQSLDERHAKEREELEEKAKTMLEAVPKGDRKKKKKVKDQIADLERELQNTHSQERYDLITADASDDDSDKSNAEEPEPKPAAPPQQEPIKRKKNRQKERLARREAREAEERAQIEAELEGTVSVKEQEDAAFGEVLKGAKLDIFEIKPDGHCLYNAVGHQLAILDADQWPHHNERHWEIRAELAKYMRDHPDDFAPFLADAADDAPTDLDSYCDRLEKTAFWGGQVELMGLSQLYKICIRVYQSQGNPLVFGEDFTSRDVNLSYHRHSYGLGEHYNSLVHVSGQSPSGGLGLQAAAVANLGC